MPTSASLRLFIAALMLSLAAALTVPAAGPAQAQSVNPTAQSVKEKELLKELGRAQGRSSLPDTRARVLEQPDWQQFHQVTLRRIGAVAILGMLAVLVLFYLIRGMVKIENGRSGRTLVRFNSFERFVHWMTAASFVVLALSGLNITFGKELLTPLIGAVAFAE
jgi:formate dehydrogenase subunit gamma